MITLDQLLQSRDRRARHQKDLLGDYPGKSLLCFTVQLPGPVKRNAMSLTVARAGVDAIRETFPIEVSEERDLDTGFEGYFIVSLPPFETKLLACSLEDTHPLGRLMDLDVVESDGPLSRDSVGLPARRCLLCDREARYCMRARAHSAAELLARIEEMVNAYEPRL